MNVRTTTKDLLEALSQAGFPPEKITVKDEHKAEIDLGGAFYTITDAQIGHAFLYDNNNTLKYLDFIHTPADLVAACLVSALISRVPFWFAKISNFPQTAKELMGNVKREPSSGSIDIFILLI